MITCQSTHSHIEGDTGALQVTVHLHVVQSRDTAVRALFTVLCAQRQGGSRRREGLGEVETEGLQVGSSLREEGEQWLCMCDGRKRSCMPLHRREVSRLQEISRKVAKHV